VVSKIIEWLDDMHGVTTKIYLYLIHLNNIFSTEVRRFPTDAQRDPRNIKSAPVLWQRIHCLLLVLQTLRSVYLTVLFSNVTNCVATAVLPIFPHHTLTRTASHIATGLVPLPRNAAAPIPPLPTQYTLGTTFSTLQLILPSWSWQQHTNLKRRWALYWSISQR